MKITKADKETHSIITIHADTLNSALAPELKAEFVLLNKNGVKNIVVDLSEVNYCDSSGLSALLVGNRLCNELGGKFIINSLQEMVERLITISQLDKVLNITKSLEEANEILA